MNFFGHLLRFAIRGINERRVNEDFAIIRGLVGSGFCGVIGSGIFGVACSRICDGIGREIFGVIGSGICGVVGSIRRSVGSGDFGSVCVCAVIGNGVVAIGVGKCSEVSGVYGVSYIIP